MFFFIFSHILIHFYPLNIRIFYWDYSNNKEAACLRQKDVFILHVIMIYFVEILHKPVRDNVKFIIHQLLFEVKRWAAASNYTKQYFVSWKHCPSQSIMFSTLSVDANSHYYWQQRFANLLLPMYNLSWSGEEEEESRMRSWKVEVMEEDVKMWRGRETGGRSKTYFKWG